MGILLLIIIAIVGIVLFKKLKKPNTRNEVKEDGEIAYIAAKAFLNDVKDKNFTDSDLQRIMTFVEGFSRFTEIESEYRNVFANKIGYNIMSKNPHMFVRIQDKELECFIFSNGQYALSLNKETKDLEISRIR